MNDFLLILISLFSLLTIASYTSVLAKKTHFPYTILLFIFGIILVFLGKIFPIFNFITKLELSKDLVFYIFLPTLIFESAYNMPYKKILRDALPISGLSVFSLIISTVIIGFALKVVLGLFHIEIPYIVSFLFGAIISATDPVAVLSIFKEIGVPKRIMYLFEAESLFNDGTAVALFMIIFEIIKQEQSTSFDAVSSSMTFISMIIGGIFFGLFMGWLFSKLIEWVRHSWAELTLTLILAHTTFIMAELISEYFTIFKISAIISTTIASLTLGNYGRYKISHDVRSIMDITWGYFAFISNSLIFLLMGIMIGNIDFHLTELFIPIIISIIVVILARMTSVISVLTPINFFIKHPISWNWQKLIAWGSLRGAIAITMLLFIPDNLIISGWMLDISIKEFVSIIAISCIVFTLLIKAVSIKGIVHRMGLVDLTKEESFTLHQLKDIIDNSILKRLYALKEKHYVPDAVVDFLIKKYQKDYKKEIIAIEQCHLNKNEFKILLKRYALGVERRSILDSFRSKEVDEITLKKILNKIEEQYMRIEMGIKQTKEDQEKETFCYNLKEKLKNLFATSRETLLRKQYIFYRARAFIAEQVLEQLRSFKEEFCSNKEHDDCFDEIIKQYESWYDAASKKMFAIEDELKNKIYDEEIELINNHFIHMEQDLIKKLYSKHIMNNKVKKMLQEFLEGK